MTNGERGANLLDSGAPFYEEDAYEHPHLTARQTFIEVAGLKQPAPAPRFSRTKPEVPRPPVSPSPENSVAALGAWLSEPEITAHAAVAAFN